MAIITLDFAKISKDTKIRFAQEMTQKASEILHVQPNSITIVIKENDLDNISIGGNLLSDLRK